MIIRELNLKHFGKFFEQSLRFCDGINVIYGPNEAGKTTIYHAIGALLFGLEKQRGRAAGKDIYTLCQPWERMTWYEAGMKFETGGKLFRLERNFYQREKSARLICETDGEELSVEQGDLNMLLGETDAELYFNTAAVGQLKMKPQESVYRNLQNYIVNLQEAGSQEVDVVRALEILEKKRKELEKQKKKRVSEIGQLIEKTDAKLELIEKEIRDCGIQLEALVRQKREEKPDNSDRPGGFFARLLRWLKNLFFGKHWREEERRKKEEKLKLAEKERFLRELCGEKESIREELQLEKESYYKKLHEESKKTEIRAVELAMERIREVSEVRKEEIMERLFLKASGVFRDMTGGKYEKLISEDDLSISLWDGNRKLKLFQVSTGCAEQVWLSFRIALQDLFFEEDRMPLIFDDAFVYFDDQRLERLLSYLEQTNRQIILLSCHKREIRILEKLGYDYQKILL